MKPLHRFQKNKAVCRSFFWFMPDEGVNIPAPTLHCSAVHPLPYNASVTPLPGHAAPATTAAAAAAIHRNSCFFFMELITALAHEPTDQLDGRYMHRGTELSSWKGSWVHGL